MNLFIDRGASRHGVINSIECVLEFWVLGEEARVIGILLYSGFIATIQVRVGVAAGAKVNAKSDGGGYNGGYC